MQQATNQETIYTGRLKHNKNLNVTKLSITVLAEERGTEFAVYTKNIRYAMPNGTKVRLFWRAPARIQDDMPDLQWFKHYYDLELDIKAMYPDKKARKAAEKTEASHLAMTIQRTTQSVHTMNKPIPNDYLAMHTGEHLVKECAGQSKWGAGKLYITNMGAYFIADGVGLVYDMPFELFDAIDYDKKTLKMYNFEPTWVEGYEPSEKKQNKTEIRLGDADPAEICDILNKEFKTGGAEEVRQLSEYSRMFGNMNADQFFETLYGRNYTDPVGPLDIYLWLVAKNKWGAPSHDEVANFDYKVVAACLCTGIPLDVAGDLTKNDARYRGMLLDWIKNHTQAEMVMGPLRNGIYDILTKGMEKEDSDHVRGCNVFMIYDILIEVATNGLLHPTFTPKSLEVRKKWTAPLVEKAKKAPDSARLLKLLDTGAELPNYWSQAEATKILKNGDFADAMDALEEAAMQHDPQNRCRVPADVALYHLDFREDHLNESLERAERVYDEWCSKKPVPEYSDPASQEWVEYMLEHIDEEKSEMKKKYSDYKTSTTESLRNAMMASKNTSSRIERTLLPEDIDRKHLYTDTWHDREKQLWFTTNPSSIIAGTGLATMSYEQCSHKFGFRALAFPESIVEMRHGQPAVKDPSSGLGVILSTVDEDAITKEMYQEYSENHLAYETKCLRVSLGNDGSIKNLTPRELELDYEMFGRGALLPLGERMRRVLFASVACTPLTMRA